MPWALSELFYHALCVHFSRMHHKLCVIFFLECTRIFSKTRTCNVLCLNSSGVHHALFQNFSRTHHVLCPDCSTTHHARCLYFSFFFFSRTHHLLCQNFLGNLSGIILNSAAQWHEHNLKHFTLPISISLQSRTHVNRPSFPSLRLTNRHITHIF